MRQVLLIDTGHRNGYNGVMSNNTVIPMRIGIGALLLEAPTWNP